MDSTMLFQMEPVNDPETGRLSHVTITLNRNGVVVTSDLHSWSEVRCFLDRLYKRGPIPEDAHRRLCAVNDSYSWKRKFHCAIAQCEGFPPSNPNMALCA